MKGILTQGDLPGSRIIGCHPRALCSSLFLKICGQIQLSKCFETALFNMGTISHSFLQGFFPTQGSNPGLLHCRQILYHLSHQGHPISHTGLLKQKFKFISSITLTTFQGSITTCGQWLLSWNSVDIEHAHCHGKVYWTVLQKQKKKSKKPNAVFKKLTFLRVENSKHLCSKASRLSVPSGPLIFSFVSFQELSCNQFLPFLKTCSQAKSLNSFTLRCK